MITNNIKKKLLKIIYKKGEQALSPLSLQYNLLKYKKEFGINLPETYVEMLRVSDGGEVGTFYYPNRRKDLMKSDYFSISRFHGLTSGYATIRSEKIEQKELLFDNWLGDFVNDFFDFIEINSKSVEEYRKKGIIPKYLYRYEDYSVGVKVGNNILHPHRVDNIILNKLYNDKTYLNHMNSEIGEVAEIDYRTLLGRLRGNYNFSMALINSYEFATFDGHDSICFHYGDEKRKEPSVWYVNLELKKAFELAMDFKTFLCNLLVKRKDYAISITKLNDDTVCYIEDLIQNVFADNHFSLDINDLINATKDRWGYSYKKEGKFNVEVAQNKYFDNSGYRVPEYKDVEWVLKVKPHVNGSSDLSCEKFIQEYESKIQEVSKKYKKAGINILHEMGFHKFVDEISE